MRRSTKKAPLRRTLFDAPVAKPKFKPMSKQEQSSRLKRDFAAVHGKSAVARRKAIPDYEVLHINPLCNCKGKGDHFHNLNVRCKTCVYCGQRIKGMWFNEHEAECWSQLRAAKQTAGAVTTRRGAGRR